MHGPYREAPAAASEDAPRVPDREEVVGYALVAGAGALPVAGALAHGEPFHAAATIGLVMVIAGALGLAASARAAWSARSVRRAARK